MMWKNSIHLIHNVQYTTDLRTFCKNSRHLHRSPRASSEPHMRSSTLRCLDTSGCDGHFVDSSLQKALCFHRALRRVPEKGFKNIIGAVDSCPQPENYIDMTYLFNVHLSNSLFSLLTCWSTVRTTGLLDRRCRAKIMQLGGTWRPELNFGKASTIEKPSEPQDLNC